MVLNQSQLAYLWDLTYSEVKQAERSYDELLKKPDFSYDDYNYKGALNKLILLTETLTVLNYQLNEIKGLKNLPL